MDGELPNIVCRCVSAYSDLRLKVKATKGGFWSCVPPMIHEWRAKLSASTNKLAEFFEMDDHERGCKIACVEGRVTWLSDFKKHFEEKMGKGTYVADPAVFAGLGFRLSQERVNVCKACKQLAKGECCDSRGDRTVKTVLHNLEMVKNG